MILLFHDCVCLKKRRSREEARISTDQTDVRALTPRVDWIFEGYRLITLDKEAPSHFLSSQAVAYGGVGHLASCSAGSHSCSFALLRQKKHLLFRPLLLKQACFPVDSDINVLLMC